MNLAANLLPPTDQSQSATSVKVTSKPSVYAYEDLASYLRDICQYKKGLNARWTLGVWSKQLGLKGSGTLSNFMSGRRVPTDSILCKIKRDLQLSEYELIYFDALVVVSSQQADTLLKKKAIELLYLRKLGKAYQEIPNVIFEVISDPLCLILREAVKLDGFQWDSRWIKSHLKVIDVGTDRIDEVIQKLISVGYLRVSEGQLIHDDRFLKTPIDHSREAIRCYYEAALDLNRKAIRAIVPEERHFNSINFSCSKDRLPELKEMIHEFSRACLERFDEPGGSVVYQLHTQLVPHFESDPNEKV